MKKYFTILFLFVALISCTKELVEEAEPVEEMDIYGYKIECDSCMIMFVDEKQNEQSIFNRTGEVLIEFPLYIYHDLEVKVIINTENIKRAQAAILKNGAILKSYQSYSSFKLTPSGATSIITTPTTNPTNPSNPKNPTNPTNPTSSVCGAKNKTGGYCKRVVSGGGRCWQHR